MKCPRLRSFAARELSVNVRTELALLAPGTTDWGENEHFKLLGKPEQVKAIALLNDPEVGATLTVSFPDPPAVMVVEEGLAPRLNPELPPPDSLQFNVVFTAGEI
jgi:hypothetical protein